MTVTHKNRVKTTVSAVASSGLGAFTISTASSGYRTFAAGDDGKSFDCLITEGTAWEVRTGCAYTHSGTSLARGTLEDSSTGSAVAFTSAAVVSIIATAAWGNKLELQLDRAYTLVHNAAANTQSLTGGAESKITCMNTEAADPQSWWDTTNHRFTPTRAGNFLVICGAQLGGSTALTQASVWKNGAGHTFGGLYSSAPASAQVTAVVGFNGSTDYAEFYFYTDIGRTTESTVGRVYFQAIYLGP